jgi:hypothetical protein
MLLREERDGLGVDKEDLLLQVDALKGDLAKNDANFKKTLENDRQKLKQELMTRSARIRMLEQVGVI